MLGDFSARRDPETSRQQYVTQLLKDLCSYYGYNEWLMEKLFSLFPHEIMEFLEANEVNRPVSTSTILPPALSNLTLLPILSLATIPLYAPLCPAPLRSNPPHAPTPTTLHPTRPLFNLFARFKPKFKVSMRWWTWSHIVPLISFLGRSCSKPAASTAR